MHWENLQNRFSFVNIEFLNMRTLFERDKDAEDVETILARLDELRMKSRMPLINTKCSCEAPARKVNTVQNDLVISDEEDSSSDDSDDDCGKSILLHCILGLPLVVASKCHVGILDSGGSGISQTGGANPQGGSASLLFIRGASHVLLPFGSANARFKVFQSLCHRAFHACVHICPFFGFCFNFITCHPIAVIIVTLITDPTNRN